jgi:hypothetical protein
VKSGRTFELRRELRRTQHVLRAGTCLDQYNANKANNANGGMRWIERGGGYYSECNRRLKG